MNNDEQEKKSSCFSLVFLASIVKGRRRDRVMGGEWVSEWNLIQNWLESFFIPPFFINHIFIYQISTLQVLLSEENWGYWLSIYVTLIYFSLGFHFLLDQEDELLLLHKFSIFHKNIFFVQVSCHNNKYRVSDFWNMFLCCYYLWTLLDGVSVK